MAFLEFPAGSMMIANSHIPMKVFTPSYPSDHRFFHLHSDLLTVAGFHGSPCRVPIR